MTQADIDVLVTNIASALPGSTTDPLTIPQFRDRLQQYRGIDSAVLRQHLSEFLARVTPVAESLGVTLDAASGRSAAAAVRPAAHCILGGRLSGAVRCRALERPTASASAPARSACARKTICPRWPNAFAPRIGFAHLRATKREGDGLSFFESDHLDGDVDMIAVLKALLAENRKRSSRDQIVFRPDHGHRMLDDLAETKRTNPGYTAIGRLRGLAELPRRHPLPSNTAG
jgi:mannonate dehydratase